MIPRPLRRGPGALRQFAAIGVEHARRRSRGLAARAADAALERRRGTALVRTLGPCLRSGFLAPYARRLCASAEPAHRELGALLAAAMADRDDAKALKLAATALRGSDRRAEKILSHRYRFLWICNPKAASRSLIAALRAADPDALYIRQLTLEQVHARHPEARSYFSFAFLRHPLQRLRSFYADKHARARHDRTFYRHFIRPYHGVRLDMTFGELCRWLDTPCGADAFADRHWLSQWRQLADPQGRLPSFLGRYERLEEDWRTLCGRLGLPPTALPRLNPGHPAFLRDAVADPGIDALVRRRYARDYEIGGYGAAP
ncbi:MAG: sulfotransferase family 2 domain-containing protein [Rhodospirillales bacterium]|nr:sulfotransferase family 2 domain-containing protein [Rhodospirillales bacterium]